MIYETNTDNLLRKRELFDDYIAILAKYDSEISTLSEDEIDEWFSRYFEDHEYWIDIKSDDKVVGFLIVGERDGDCHPDTDYTISQVYVEKAYQNSGLASKCVLDFLSDHSGKYALDILHGNEDGRYFWNSIFKLLEIKPYSLREVRENAGPVDLIGFDC